MPRLTHERLLEVIIYDPEEGTFTNRVTRSNRSIAGRPAGGFNLDGYLMITIDGEQHRAHRLAWFYMKGVWPEGEVDHEDTDQGNNRWRNLREATSQQQKANCYKRSTNTTGYKGVTFDRSKGKFQAQIQFEGRCKFLGRFDTPEEAAAAYATASKIYFGEFSRA